ncbi:MAG: glycosyl transferase [Deltaproteobacteria bacterium]|nr:glycosyl transferase [Deltaproteobacteria bacterium]
MMQHYCTAFDSAYLLKGIALYESMLRHTQSFHLYVIAFDSDCYRILRLLNYSHMTVISLSEFESDDLLQVKESRSAAEYFWTCTPFTIAYCLDHFALESCTYLDADIYFFSDPGILIREIPETSSVLITEHRYTPCYDQTAVSGKYCVQFMTFRNNTDGRTVLRWWQDRCLEWCYARSEDGKFGDQKYLDHWPDLFKGVHELRHIGGGVAPWNVQQYRFIMGEKKTVFIQEGSQDMLSPLVFYHFHRLRFLSRGFADLGSYRLSSRVKLFIYQPYLRHLEEIRARVLEKDLLPSAGKQKFSPAAYWQFFRTLLRNFRNIVPVRTL